jgi:hypothetical protein
MVGQFGWDVRWRNFLGPKDIAYLDVLEGSFFLTVPQKRDT